MASRVITVMVVDGKGYGKYGYEVWAYGGDHFRTDKNGKVDLLIEGDTASIYVNGRTAYDGSLSRCPNPLLVRRE